MFHTSEKKYRPIYSIFKLLNIGTGIRNYWAGSTFYEALSIESFLCWNLRKLCCAYRLIFRSHMTSQHNSAFSKDSCCIYPPLHSCIPRLLSSGSYHWLDREFLGWNRLVYAVLFIGLYSDQPLVTVTNQFLWTSQLTQPCGKLRVPVIPPRHF